MSKLISPEELSKLISYDKDSGDFYWSVNKYRAKAGQRTGWKNKRGAVVIRINQRNYYAHVIAWVLSYGDYPQKEIDHIDGNPSNNSLANLRLADRSQNSQNMRKARTNNKSGFLGVVAHQGLWRARITINGKQVCLGVHETKELAHAAYLAAKRKLHEYCTI